MEHEDVDERRIRRLTGAVRSIFMNQRDPAAAARSTEALLGNEDSPDSAEGPPPGTGDGTRR